MVELRTQLQARKYLLNTDSNYLAILMENYVHFHIQKTNLLYLIYDILLLVLQNTCENDSLETTISTFLSSKIYILILLKKHFNLSKYYKLIT